jgi:VWFA-related protein
MVPLMRKLAFFLCAVTAIAQAPPAATPPAAPSPLIVRFQFEPKKGQPATDLTPADIEIREDGAPQQAVLFEGGRSRPRTLPVHVDLFFDCDRLALSGTPLVPGLLQENLLNANENALISIYGFNGGAVRLSAPTRDPARLKKALDSPMSGHPVGTLFLDHIKAVAVDSAATGPAIRMLVILSSAQPDSVSTSQTSKRELFDSTVRTALGSGVTLYPVVLKLPFGSQASDSSSSSKSGGRATSSAPSPAADASGQDALRSIGDFQNLGSATGGESYEALSGTDLLPKVLKSISKAIQDDYVAGFNPPSTGGGKRHKIEVVLRDKNRGKIVGGSFNVVH